MTGIQQIQLWVDGLNFPAILVVGFMTVCAFFTGRLARRVRLPSIVGFMLMGVILGPSLFDLLSESVLSDFSFITEIALSFVALSIGLELKLSSLKRQGTAILSIILGESLLAFVAVTGVLYAITRDLPLSLLFGAIAPASAPAGTVAVIQEYRAKGKLTDALYAVVGFDDGLGVVIFGFASAVAFGIVSTVGSTGLSLALKPLTEIGLSLGTGTAIGLLFALVSRRTKSARELFILVFAAIFLCSGVSILLDLSYILSNMVVGILIVNVSATSVVEKVRNSLSGIMPLLFVMFFVLAGANLHLAALPALGIIGLGYIGARTVGKMTGATLGAFLGKAEPVLKRYLGLGILSQAGVAIGLALIVKQEFSGLGEWGSRIGTTVITAVTATSIFFELIGPVCAKIALTRAGEIPNTVSTKRKRG